MENVPKWEYSQTPVSAVDYDKQWCVYEHHRNPDEGTGPAELVYIGSCRIVDVYRLRDARLNTEWQRLFGDGRAVMVKIVAIYNSQHEAQNAAFNLIRAKPTMPICNERGYTVFQQQRRIKCSNGKIYKNQTEAAMDLGVSQSAVSQCLRGLIPSVRGYGFVYDAGGQ